MDPHNNIHYDNKNTTLNDQEATAMPDKPQDALDKAFHSLKTYQWDTPRETLAAIDQAVAGAFDRPDRQKELEKRLAAQLGGNLPDAARDFICRQLRLIGTAASVPALTPLLADKKYSDMARFALERMACPEAQAALRKALPKTTGLQKLGIINSLGVRRDAQSLDALKALLDHADKAVAAAAFDAIGAIGTPDAAALLTARLIGSDKVQAEAAAHALLTCADHLTAAGQAPGAVKIFKRLMGKAMPPHIRRAALNSLSEQEKK